jgi:hypothetical protein
MRPGGPSEGNEGEPIASRPEAVLDRPQGLRMVHGTSVEDLDQSLVVRHRPDTPSSELGCLLKPVYEAKQLSVKRARQVSQRNRLDQDGPEAEIT